MMPTILKMTSPKRSIEIEDRLGRARRSRAARSRTGSRCSRTWSSSPCTNAPTNVSGMMSRKNSTVDFMLAGLGVLRDRVGVELGRIDVHARAGLDDVDDDEADHERDRARDLEVEQGEAAGLADRLHALHAAMPTTTVQKISGAIVILTSLMKPSPSGCELRAPMLGPHHADDDAERDRDEYAEVQRRVKRLARRLVCHRRRVYGLHWSYEAGARSDAVCVRRLSADPRARRPEHPARRW